MTAALAAPKATLLPPKIETGVSLGKDAWRRLRKNRVAMACLALLLAISSLAFFTPLLPLQPPDAIDTPRQYAPPQFAPLLLNSFTLDVGAIRQADPAD